MTDADSCPSRPWFTSNDEDNSDEQATLDASAEQALAGITQRYEQATAALQTLLDEHSTQTRSHQGPAPKQACPEPGSDGA